MSLLWAAFTDDWELDHKVVFNGANRWIIVYPTVESIDIKTDVYSAWKEWLRLRDNGKYVPAVRTIGGDPTTQGQRAGDIYFLINGWKLIIDFTSTSVTGTLFSDDYGTAYFDDQLKPLYPALVSSTVNTVENTTTPVVGIDQADLDAIPANTATQVWEAAIAVAVANHLRDMWQRLGLDVDHPVTNQPDGGFTVDGIDVDATTDGSGNVIQTRQ